jgi:hypothetical protein
MTKLLWLCTIALGHRMLQEQSYEWSFRWMARLRKALRVVSVLWVLDAIYVAYWFWTQP